MIVTKTNEGTYGLYLDYNTAKNGTITTTVEVRFAETNQPYDKMTVIGTGTARVHTNDKKLASKPFGRKLAIVRALENSRVTRATRKAIFNTIKTEGVKIID